MTFRVTTLGGLVAALCAGGANAAPRRVIGNGTPASCTSAAVVSAVARGGTICLDGNRFVLTLSRSVFEDNVAPEGGGAIFFVSNDRTGTATLAASTLRRNRSVGFETPRLPGIFFLGARLPSLTQGTTITR